MADTDLLVHVLVGKVIGTLCHGTHKDAYALLGVQAVDVVPDPNDGGIEAERYLAAVGWQVVGYGVLNHAQELLLRVGRPDGQAMQKLDHQSSKALECSRDADRGGHLNEDTLGGLDVDLQLARLVYRRVKQCK